jgi:hypothetical protein
MAKIALLPPLINPTGRELVVVADPEDANKTKAITISALAEGAAAVTVARRSNTIFTPATRAHHIGAPDFVNYYDRFHGLSIEVPADLNGVALARLFVSVIGLRSTAPQDDGVIGLSIAQLRADGTFEDVAECFQFEQPYNYFDGLTFVAGSIVGVGAYAGRITGKIRMDRTTAWNYFYAGGNNAAQIARAYVNGIPNADALEIDPAFITIARGGAQPIWSVFSATAFAQNTHDTTFLSRIDTLFDMRVELAAGFSSARYTRLFVTAITSEGDAVKLPAIKFSMLNAANQFVLVATGRAADGGVSDTQFDGNSQFVEYDVVPEAGYTGLVSGSFKWLRASGWDYWYNKGKARNYTNAVPRLGCLELAQDVIVPVVGQSDRILPATPSYPGMLNRLPKFADHYLKGDRDVTMVVIGDSIVTAINYAPNRPDANTRPPLCHQYTLFSYVEEQLRWRGQQYRRFDVGGLFTEIGGAQTLEYDAAWDWQINPPLTPALNANYKPAITRVLSGNNAAVAYAFPADMRRCDFIYRTDYLCAAQTSVSIGAGNGIVEVLDEASGAWVEANGYVFSAKEADVVLNHNLVDYDGAASVQPLRRSAYQQRLRMRSGASSVDKTVTISNLGAGRLNYWGIEYSPRAVMFRAINSARGGHNISRIRAYEEWDVHAWKPDLIWLNNQVINEGAMSAANMPAGNTPPAFAQRFSDFTAALRGKAYAPDLLTSTMFCGVQAQIVDQVTGAFRAGSIPGYGAATVFDFVGHLDRVLAAANIPHINMFYEFLRLAERKAAAEGTGNIWTSAMAGSGVDGGTMLFDGVHPNEYGNLVAKILFLPAFDTLH